MYLSSWAQEVLSVRAGVPKTAGRGPRRLWPNAETRNGSQLRARRPAYSPPDTITPPQRLHRDQKQGLQMQLLRGAFAQWRGRRANVRRTPVAGRRPGRGPEAGARPLGRREMARGWRGARGQPGHSQPERPLARHTWARNLVGPPGRPRPCTSTHGDPWKPWRLARCPQPRHTHIPGPGTPCVGYRSTTRRDGARPRPGHAPGRLRWGRDQDSASSASALAPASQRVVVPRCEPAQEGGHVLNAHQARSPAFLREIPSGFAPGSGSYAH